MELIAWNSQGSKWDTLWNHYLDPLLPATESVLACIVEAGWAPWVRSQDVQHNALYAYDNKATYYPDPAPKSDFCQGMAGTGTRTRRSPRMAVWIPWVGNLEALKTNTRCSMGMFFAPATGVTITSRSHNLNFQRPVFILTLRINRNAFLTIVLVHLVSSSKAATEFDKLVAALPNLIPGQTPALIVGDMNVDLLTGSLNLPDKSWTIVRTGGPTQQLGGELDYAVLYNPNKNEIKAAARVVEQYKTGENTSDHSVIRYSLPSLGMT